EELQVLAGEDAELAVPPERDEALHAVLDAERDHDLPPSRAEEMGDGFARRLELRYQRGALERLERVDGILRDGLAAVALRICAAQPAAGLVDHEDLAALDVEDLRKLVTEPADERVLVEHVHERGGEPAQPAAVIVVLRE